MFRKIKILKPSGASACLFKIMKRAWMLSIEIDSLFLEKYFEFLETKT